MYEDSKPSTSNILFHFCVVRIYNSEDFIVFMSMSLPVFGHKMISCKKGWKQVDEIFEKWIIKLIQEVHRSSESFHFASLSKCHQQKVHIQKYFRRHVGLYQKIDASYQPHSCGCICKLQKDIAKSRKKQSRQKVFYIL